MPISAQKKKDIWVASLAIAGVITTITATAFVVHAIDNSGRNRRLQKIQLQSSVAKPSLHNPKLNVAPGKHVTFDPMVKMSSIGGTETDGILNVATVPVVPAVPKKGGCGCGK